MYFVPFAGTKRVPLSVIALGFTLAFIVALLLPVTLDSTSSEAPQNLLANGGFEQPVVDVGGFVPLSSGPEIPGWRIVGTPGTVGAVSTAFLQNGIRFTAKAGAQWLDLTGSNNAATGIAQTVESRPGSHYRLSFAVGNVVDPGGLFGVSSTVDVLVNGNRVLAATNSGGAMTQAWKTFTLPIDPKIGT